MKNKAKVVKKDDGWWISGFECWLDHGPYQRKDEAKEDAAGLQRTFDKDPGYWLAIREVPWEEAPVKADLESMPATPQVEVVHAPVEPVAKKSASAQGEKLKQMILKWSEKSGASGVGVS